MSNTKTLLFCLLVSSLCFLAATQSTGTTTAFDPRTFVASLLTATSFPTNFTDVQKSALTAKMADLVGKAKSIGATNTALVAIITENLAAAKTAMTAAMAVPPPEGTAAAGVTLYLSHASAVPADKTQSILFGLVIKIALRSNSQIIDPKLYTVVWTSDNSAFFGTAGSLFSLDATLVALDLATKVKSGDRITFTATVTEIKTKTVTVLTQLVIFSGSLPILAVTTQADDDIDPDTFGTRRVVTFSLTNLPTFINLSTNPPGLNIETKSLANYYNANIRMTVPLSGTFKVKFAQPPQTVQIKLAASIQGGSASYSVTFNLSPTTNAALLKPGALNLTTITPTASNLGDITAVMAVKVGSQIAPGAAPPSSDPKTACAASSGTWVDSKSTFGVDGYCNRTYNAADTKQIQGLADTTLAMFATNSATFPPNDQLGFIKTLGSVRTSGCPIPVATVGKALDSLATLAQTFSQSASLVNTGTVGGVGGVNVGPGSSSGDLRTALKGILQARNELVVPDAKTISGPGTDASAVDSAKANQRKSMTMLDNVLSSFAAARSTLGDALTVSSGTDTLFSSDICLTAYQTLADTDLISISIDPKSGAAADTDITVSTKFGFAITKATLKAIINDKMGGAVNCINVGGIKTSKASGSCGFAGVNSMSNEVVGFKVFDSTGAVVNVTGYTMFLEIPCSEFKPETLNLTASSTLAVKYLNPASEIPAVGGTLVRLGADKTTCIVSVNHLSSYAMSSDTSSTTTTTAAAANNTQYFAVYSMRMGANFLMIVLLSVIGAVFCY